MLALETSLESATWLRYLNMPWCVSAVNVI